MPSQQRKTDPDVAQPAEQPSEIQGRTLVYPVEGAFLSGIPAASIETNAETAGRLMATGAFRAEPPELEEGQTAPEPITLTSEALSVLDYYDPPAQPADETSGEQPGESQEA